MEFIQDISYGLRSLRQRPGFAAVAVLSLALGIGANSAMFSFADALMLRPLPVSKASEIVSVSTRTPVERFSGLSYPEYAACRDDGRTLSGLIAYRDTAVGMSAAADELPQVTYGLGVSANLFSVLGVEPAVGRGFRPEEDSPAGPHNVLVISDGMWDRRFHRRPDIVGLHMKVNGLPFTVIGVTPARFGGTEQFFRPDFYVPLAAFAEITPGEKGDWLNDRAARPLRVLGRLRPGVSAKTAQAEFSTIAQHFEQAWPESNRARSLTVLPEIEWRQQRDTNDWLLARMLMGVAGFVLLIACANVASLLLGRGSARSKEIAIRLAVGAGRARLVRQLLTESLLLAFLGGAAGLLVAYGGVRYQTSIQLPTDVPLELAARLDGRLVFFNFAVATLTAVLFGLFPAWRTVRPELAPTLKGGATAGSGGMRKFAARNLLVIGQTALSVVLLIAAGLLVKSFILTRTAGPGFRTDHILLVSFDPALASFSEEQGRSFYLDIVTRVKTLPGVESAALAHWVLLGNEMVSRDLVVEGYEMPRDQETLEVWTNYVDARFFHTLATPLIRGRFFDERDTSSSARVAIVNETMARRYWPGRDPIGKLIHLDKRGGPSAAVIGIVKDTKYLNALESLNAFLYLPFTQNYQSRMTLHVHTFGDPAQMAGTVRASVRALAPNLPIYDVRTMDDIFLNKGLLAARILAVMVGTMGSIGLVLAAIGLYSVIAFAVSRRTREIGIRMAIGAAPRNVLAMVLRQGMRLALAGVAIGLAGAFVLTGLMEHMLDRVGPRDTAIFVSIPVVLAAVALAACYVPAKSAASVDPNSALRSE